MCGLELIKFLLPTIEFGHVSDERSFLFGGLVAGAVLLRRAVQSVKPVVYRRLFCR